VELVNTNKEMKRNSKSSRRSWLNISLWAGTGILAGTGLRGLFKWATHRRTKYIAADGTVYTVEASRFLKRKKKKVTNAELKSWIGDRY
jgi:hypothetical protein